MEITIVVIRNEDDDIWSEAFAGHVDTEAAIARVKERLIKEFEEDSDGESMTAFVNEFFTFSASHAIASTLEA